MENERLNVNPRQIEQKLMENRDAVHELIQYNRSSYMMELSVIPFKKSKNCLLISNKVGRMTHKEDYEPGQVDVAHRTSKKKTAPITILFHKKSDRQNFYKQKVKLY